MKQFDDLLLCIFYLISTSFKKIVMSSLIFLFRSCTFSLGYMQFDLLGQKWLSAITTSCVIVITIWRFPLTSVMSSLIIL